VHAALSNLIPVLKSPVNPAGEVTRKDVYANGAQRREAFRRAGL
jgi:hypothetical protein